MRWLVLLFLVPGIAQAQLHSDQPAALITYPYLTADAAHGIDTELQLTNTCDKPVSIECAYEDTTLHCVGNQAVCQSAADCTDGTACQLQWAALRFRLRLARHQAPLAWRFSAGLDPLPDPESSGTIPAAQAQPFIGVLRCTAVTAGGRPLPENCLIGSATVVTDDGTTFDRARYNAFGSQGLSGDADFDGALQLAANGESLGCANVHRLQFVADGLIDPVIPSSAETTLILVPCGVDYAHQTPATVTLSPLTVINELGSTFGAGLGAVQGQTIRRLTSIDGRDPARSIFHAGNLGTSTGQLRIAGDNGGVMVLALERQRDNAMPSRFSSVFAAAPAAGTRPTPERVVWNTPLPTPSPGCGNGQVEAGEQCDDGGRCVGGSDAGMPCASDLQCYGDGICDGGAKSGYRCAADGDCPVSRCVRCRPTGGDGCAVNCTVERRIVFELRAGQKQGSLLAPHTSGFLLRGFSPVAFPVAGSRVLTVGAANADGTLPFVIKEADAPVERVPVSSAACFCARPLELKTCGGTLFEPDGTATPLCNSLNAQCPQDRPCVAIYGRGNAAAGLIGCGPNGLDATDETLGVCTACGGNQCPGGLGDSIGGGGAPGSLVGLASVATRTFVGTCQPEYCAADAPLASQRGDVKTFRITTGSATGTFFNGECEGRTYGPFAAQGRPLRCADLLAQAPSITDLSLVGMWPDVNGVFGNTIQFAQLAALVTSTPLTASPTPTTVATPTPTPRPACTGDCDGNGIVSAGEITRIIARILSCAGAPMAACSLPAGPAIPACVAGDRNSNGVLSAGELTQAINNVLISCPLP
jgi:hypothetical protein